MPTFTDLDQEAIDQISKNGTSMPETIKTRENNMGHLDTFAQKNYNCTLKEACNNMDVEKINTILKAFFHAFRVKSKDGEELYPKRNTANTWLSHLKKGIYLLSEKKIDFDQLSDFQVSTKYLDIEYSWEKNLVISW